MVGVGFTTTCVGVGFGVGFGVGVGVGCNVGVGVDVSVVGTEVAAATTAGVLVTPGSTVGVRSLKALARSAIAPKLVKATNEPIKKRQSNARPI